MNAQLEDDVRSANARDSRVLEPTDIAVSGDGGGNDQGVGGVTNKIRVVTS